MGQPARACDVSLVEVVISTGDYGKGTFPVLHRQEMRSYRNTMAQGKETAMSRAKHRDGCRRIMLKWWTDWEDAEDGYEVCERHCADALCKYAKTIRRKKKGNDDAG